MVGEEVSEVEARVVGKEGGDGSRKEGADEKMNVENGLILSN